MPLIKKKNIRRKIWKKKQEHKNMKIFLKYARRLQRIYMNLNMVRMAEKYILWWFVYGSEFSGRRQKKIEINIYSYIDTDSARTMTSFSP